MSMFVVPESHILPKCDIRGGWYIGLFRGMRCERYVGHDRNNGYVGHDRYDRYIGNYWNDWNYRNDRHDWNNGYVGHDWYFDELQRACGKGKDAAYYYEEV